MQCGAMRVACRRTSLEVEVEVFVSTPGEPGMKKSHTGCVRCSFGTARVAERIERGSHTDRFLACLFACRATCDADAMHMYVCVCVYVAACSCSGTLWC